MAFSTYGSFEVLKYSTADWILWGYLILIWYRSVACKYIIVLGSANSSPYQSVPVVIVIKSNFSLNSATILPTPQK